MIACHHRFKTLLLPALAVALLASADAVCGASQPVSLTVVDGGIGHWKPSYVLGADFRDTTFMNFLDLPRASQILVPMPAYDGSAPFPKAALKRRIASTVAARLRDGLAHGQNEFEIRLVEHMDLSTYTSARQQRAADDFGAAAYQAIGEVIADLRAQGHDVGTYVVAGSNGTKVLAANLASLRLNGEIYLDGIDLFDGRAFYGPTSRLIQAVGPERVRIFNTRYDALAPYLPGSIRSIGHFETTVDLKERFPKLQAYLLTPETLELRLPPGHILGMVKPDARFTVKEYIGDGFMREWGPGTISGKGLRPSRRAPDGTWVSHLSEHASPARVTFRPLHAVRELFQVPRDKAEGLVAAVFSYANVLKDADDRARRNLRFLGKLSPREKALLKSAKYVKAAFDLVEAVRRDLDASRNQKFVFLRSHSLEAMGRFGLATVKFLGLEDNPHVGQLTRSGLKHVDDIADVMVGAARHIGQGRLDADIVDRYLNGLKALAHAQLARRKIPAGRLALLDGLQDLAFTGLKHHQRRHLDVEVVTGYLDAVNNLAWTGLGAVACKGNYDCTRAIQTFGTTAATVGRDATYGLFKGAELAHRGQAREVIDQWRATQQRNLYLGAPVQPISAVYGRELLRDNGLSDDQITALDNAARTSAVSLRARPPEPPAGRPLEAPREARLPADDRGGVDIDVGAPNFRSGDLSDLRRSVLRSRPKRQLHW